MFIVHIVHLVIREVALGLAGLYQFTDEARLGRGLFRSLDALLEILWPQVEAGDQGAVDRSLKIMQRRAALRGLDAPTKVAPTDPTGEKEYTTFTDEERLARIAALIKIGQDSA